MRSTPAIDGADHAIAHMENTVAPSEVDHDSQFPTMSLSFNLAPDATLGQAQLIIQDTIAGMRMPGDIRLDFTGDFRRFQQQSGDTLLLILGAIITVYIVLGMLYESLIHPVTILSTLPSGRRRRAAGDAGDEHRALDRDPRSR